MVRWKMSFWVLKCPFESWNALLTQLTVSCVSLNVILHVNCRRKSKGHRISLSKRWKVREKTEEIQENCYNFEGVCSFLQLNLKNLDKTVYQIARIKSISVLSFLITPWQQLMRRKDEEFSEQFLTSALTGFFSKQ